jgi:hypothetical protein
MFGEIFLFVTSIPRQFTVDACGEANTKMLVTLQQTPRKFRDEVLLQQL